MYEKEQIIKEIKKSYEEKDTAKYDELIALNKRVSLPAYIFAYSFGIISSLILGVGMCLAMQVIGSGTLMMALGIVVGVVGIIMVSINYPLFRKILAKRKNKYASQIIALSDELLNS